LITSPDFKWQGTIQVKNEPSDAMKDKPRNVINDGPPMQVASLLVISCIETLLFNWFHGQSIKHRARSEALNEVAADFSTPGKGGLFGGDGSSWDACCKEELLKLIETPLLWHVTEILLPLMGFPIHLLKAHLDSCTSSTTRLTMKAASGNVVYFVASHRRSGHRGTSALNFWVNRCLWYCILLKRPFESLDPHRNRFEDSWGKSLCVKSRFEGDDSFLRLSPSLAYRKVEIETQWSTLGFTMRLECSEDGCVEFVGCKFAVSDRGTTGVWAPDLKRSIANIPYSVSPLARSAYRSGDTATLNSLFASKFLCKALDFSFCLPRVARFYVLLADELSPSVLTLSEEDQRSVGYSSAEDVRSKISLNSTDHAFCSEKAALESLGLPTTADELQSFTHLTGNVYFGQEDISAHSLFPARWV
jgi:hypothetical protein